MAMADAFLLGMSRVVVALLAPVAVGWSVAEARWTQEEKRGDDHGVVTVERDAEVDGSEPVSSDSKSDDPPGGDGASGDREAEAPDDEAFPDPEGHVRFIPLGFQRPAEIPGALFGSVDEAVFDVEGVPLRLGEERARRLREGSRDLLARLVRLEEAQASLRREVTTARADYESLVESELGVEHWAALILDRVESLDDGEDFREARAVATRSMRAIARSGTVMIEEGVARDVSEASVAELASRREVRRHGGSWFHSEPLACDPAIVGRLTAIVVDERNLGGLGGGKFCGGFHPDLRLDYGSVEVLLCFGCREIRYTTSAASVTFDLTEAAMTKVETIARQTFRHRTFEDPEEGP